MIAARLRPFYEAQAKERQVRKPTNSVVEKIPQLDHEAKSRDEAGKVAGVNAKYVDKADFVLEKNSRSKRCADSTQRAFWKKFQKPKMRRQHATKLSSPSRVRPH